jgi:hypothetical protein
LVNFIGHQGKRYGLIDNDAFSTIIGAAIGGLHPMN